MKKILAFFVLTIGMMVGMVMTSCNDQLQVQLPDSKTATYSTLKTSVEKPNDFKYWEGRNKDLLLPAADQVKFNFDLYAVCTLRDTLYGQQALNTTWSLKGDEPVEVFLKEDKPELETSIVGKETSDQSSSKDDWTITEATTTATIQAKGAFEQKVTVIAPAYAKYTIKDMKEAVEFKGPEMSFGIKSNLEDAIEEVRDGKTYKVYNRQDTVAATLTVPAGYPSAGIEQTQTVINRQKLIFLIDKMSKRLENLDYRIQYEAEGLKLTGKEEVKGDIVEYNYDDEVGKTAFERGYAITADAKQPSNVTVSEDSLAHASVISCEMKENASKETSDGNFIRKTEGVKAIATVSDGAKPVELNVAWQSDSSLIDNSILPYAYAKDVRFEILSVEKDEQRSDAYKGFANVKAQWVITVAFDRVNKADELKTIAVEWEQSCKYGDKVTEYYFVPSVENGKPTVRKYAKHTQRDDELVSTESCNVNASITASNGNDIYANNANFTTNANGTSNVKTSSSTQGNFTVTTESGNYTSTMTNGAVSATNSFAYSFDKSIVYKNGDYSYTFNGVMPISEATDNISKTGSKTIGGESYDVYGYKTTVSGNYTIDNASITRPSDKVSRDILVKQSKEYVPSIENGKPTIKKYVGGKLVSTESCNVSANITASNGNDVYANNANFTTNANGTSNVKTSSSTQGNFTVTRENGNYTSVMRNGEVSETNSFSYSYDKSIVYKNGDYSYTFTGVMPISEATDDIVKTGSKTISGESYDVYSYKTTVSGNYTIDNAAISRPADKVSRDILVKQSKEYVPSIENGKPTIKKYVGGKLVSTESCNVNASITASNGNDVYANNANFTTNANGTSNVKTSSSTQGNFTVTRENGNYTSVMRNGEVSETNSFSYSYDKSIVYKNGDYSYTFNGVMPISEATDNISKTGSKTISGESYDVYGYKTTVSGNYTIDNTAITRPSDKVSRDILVKQVVEQVLVNHSYNGEFKSAGAKFSTIDQRNTGTIETRVNGAKVSSSTFNRKLDANATATVNGNVKITENQRGVKPALVSVQPGAATVSHSSADANGFVKRTTSRNTVIKMNDGAVIDVASASDQEVNNGRDTLDHTAIRNIEFVSADAPVYNPDLSSATQYAEDVTVYLALNVDRTTKAPATKAAGDESYPLVLTYTRFQDIVVPPTVDTTGVVTVEKNGTLKVAIYFDGVYQFTDTYNAMSGITASAGKDLTGDDIDAFVTTSNGTSNATKSNASNGRFTATKKSARYTSTLSDGNVSDKNIFDIEYTDAVEYVFGSYKHTFSVSWTEKEGVKIGTPSTQGSNEVYPYTSTLNGVHTIDGVVVGTPSDAVKRNIIIKGIEDNIPGDITGFAVSAVPALASNGKYVDGGGTREAHKCFDIHTTQGTYVVVMPLSSEITLDKVLGGDFWSGNYSQYNSGRYEKNSGKWEPAEGRDVSTGIQYLINGKVVRDLTKEDLAQWKWSNKHNGSHSCVVDGYTYTIDNTTKVLTVKHNGKVVLRVK